MNKMVKKNVVDQLLRRRRFNRTVKRLIRERGVFPGCVLLLSDRSLWLPNCGGDANNGGVRVFPSGEYFYYSDIEGEDGVLSPLEQFELEGVAVVGYPFRD